jgi:hypothetical protein
MIRKSAIESKEGTTPGMSWQLGMLGKGVPRTAHAGCNTGRSCLVEPRLREGATQVKQGIPSTAIRETSELQAKYG